MLLATLEMQCNDNVIVIMYNVMYNIPASFLKKESNILLFCLVVVATMPHIVFMNWSYSWAAELKSHQSVLRSVL